MFDFPQPTVNTFGLSMPVTTVVLLSYTINEELAFAFCTSKAVVEDVAPEPRTVSFPVGFVLLIPTFRLPATVNTSVDPLYIPVEMKLMTPEVELLYDSILLFTPALVILIPN